MSPVEVVALAEAVACLPAMTPQRLHGLAEATRPRPGLIDEAPVQAADWAAIWEALVAGGPKCVRLAREALGEGSPPAAEVASRWTAGARAAARSAPTSTTRGRSALVRGMPGYPSALVDDPEAPEVLFCQGDPFDPGPLAVALVGTRSATYYGTEVATELGAGLAAAGVSVVSGLASGIDAEGHEGVLTCFGGCEAEPDPAPGRPIGVLGAGIDVVYPRSTARVRARVATLGMLLSESPPGAPAERWRFPLRNRIIAALAPVLVVVESHQAGGALHTVDAALARSKVVMAVPGSIRSPASAGTNALLANGMPVVTCVTDVLVALELEGAAVLRRGRPRTLRCDRVRASKDLTTDERSVLAALDHTPTPTSAVLARTGARLEVVTLALDHLAELGVVRNYGDAWGLSS
jgi:DNA processing protein